MCANRDKIHHCPYSRPLSSVCRILELLSYIYAFNNFPDTTESLNCDNTVHRSHRPTGIFRSRSLPSVDQITFLDNRSTVDIEILGAYFTDNLTNTAKLSAPQPNALRGASTTTMPDFGDESEGTALDAEDENDCSCEGACGCVNRNDADTRPFIAETSNMKDSIIKLLGSKCTQPKTPNSDSSAKKFSFCSYESLIARISSTSNSYEKLDDEAVSETSRMLGKSDGRRSYSDDNSRSCFTSELSNLKENIKILNSYLARHDIGNRYLRRSFEGHKKQKMENSNSSAEIDAESCRTWRSNEENFSSEDCFK